MLQEVTYKLNNIRYGFITDIHSNKNIVSFLSDFHKVKPDRITIIQKYRL